ncbi:MAG: AAA family ATPase, partial [Xanthomonadales bacterium]|nr:AAA family ATPase [Xanthomonadales bacterium]
KTKQTRPQNILLNQILYGPPGTGKTYKTTELAVKIAEPKKYDEITKSDDPVEAQHQAIKEIYDDLVKSRRIGFTTFHQSYSYEDFIEGIRVDSDNEDNIKYKVEDGIFKEMVVLANDSTSQLSSESNFNDVSDKNIWKMSLGDTSKGDEKYQNCIENNYIGMNYGRDIDFSDAESQDDIINLYQEKKDQKYTKKDYPVTSVFRFKNEMKVGDLIIVTDGNRKYRAIGEVTGEYEFNVDDDFLFFQTRKVKWLKVLKESLPRDPLFKKGISQMTLYKLNDDSIDRSYLTQTLSETSEVKNHVLIIDEINRGNISKIFGELITLLENDKRAEASDQRTAILPYSKDKFSVPQNLYVIGTMNTADKSLAQMDLALRRRFDFIEMLPDETLFDDLNVFDINLAELLITINQRVEVLLDRDHLIGHSYFWSLKVLDTESELQIELAKIFKNKIIPLLQEYFFADWERIRWVLNDQNKAKEHQLIHMQEDEKNLLSLFGEDVAEQLSDKRYQINESAFSLAEAYQGILGSS